MSRGEIATQRRPRFVSVIIPVLNGGVGLRRCLRALEQQTLPAQTYEVIVVDNGSSEPDTAVASLFEQVRFCSEPAQGPYAARNHGVALARGDVLVFTDADCIPTPTWLEQGIRALLASPNCGLVGGKIEQFYLDASKPTAAELWSKVTCFRQQENLQVDRFAANGNLFTRRDVFERVGLFDSALISGGDVEWGWRVHAAGYEVVYSNAACVLHPAVYSLGDVRRRVARFMARRAAMQLRLGDGYIGFARSIPIHPRQHLEFVQRVVAEPQMTPVEKLKVLGVSLIVQATVIRESLRPRVRRLERPRFSRVAGDAGRESSQPG